MRNRTRVRAGRTLADRRLNLSTMLGIDVDLVLGPDADETPEDEYARLNALVDMLDSGFVSCPAADVALALGRELEPVLAGGWAA
ncbi:hypothetical protein [Streptomyces abyssomicinicus]|uniref:hypothetical protein n=1 Tax=Streptomyces abyssomicinicus TaxID=574929 RepID=UPI00124FADB5|nr:hypothetical protein [Streptomyces abyssomicinicus]